MLSLSPARFTKLKFLKYFVFSLGPIIFCVIYLIASPNPIRYYIKTVDPEYAYLFSGLNFSQLHFKIAHIDHPGTPLQLLICVIIWIMDLFSANKQGIDIVLDNPELICFTCFFILITGVLICRFTQNYFTAVFFN